MIKIPVPYKLPIALQGLFPPKKTVNQHFSAIGSWSKIDASTIIACITPYNSFTCCTLVCYCFSLGFVVAMLRGPMKTSLLKVCGWLIACWFYVYFKRYKATTCQGHLSIVNRSQSTKHSMVVMRCTWREKKKEKKSVYFLLPLVAQTLWVVMDKPTSVKWQSYGCRFPREFTNKMRILEDDLNVHYT